MNCKYSTQDIPDNINRHYLLCSLSNNDKCPMIRYCPDVKDYINVDNYKLCKFYIEHESNIGWSISTPNKVIIAKDNQLWVKDDELDQVFIVQNPYDYIPKFVKLLKNEHGDYYI